MIWFNLLMFHAGQIYYLDSFETLEECQVVEAEYESNPDYKRDKFWCPFVMVQET